MRARRHSHCGSPIRALQPSKSQSLKIFTERHALEFAHLHQFADDASRKAKLEQEAAALEEARRVGREKRRSLAMSLSIAPTSFAAPASDKENVIPSAPIDSETQPSTKPLSLVERRHGKSASLSMGIVTSSTKLETLSPRPREKGRPSSQLLPASTHLASLFSPPANSRALSDMGPRYGGLSVLVESTSNESLPGTVERLADSPQQTPKSSSSSGKRSGNTSTYSWATEFSGETSELRAAAQYCRRSLDERRDTPTPTKVDSRRKRIVALAHTVRQLEGVGSREPENPAFYDTLRKAWNKSVVNGDREDSASDCSIPETPGLPQTPQLQVDTTHHHVSWLQDAPPTFVMSPDAVDTDIDFDSIGPSSKKSSNISSNRFSYASTLHDLALDGGIQQGSRLMTEKAWLRSSSHNPMKGYADHEMRPVQRASVHGDVASTLDESDGADQLEELEVLDDVEESQAHEHQLRHMNGFIKRSPAASSLSDAPPSVPWGVALGGPWGTDKGFHSGEGGANSQQPPLFNHKRASAKLLPSPIGPAANDQNSEHLLLAGRSMSSSAQLQVANSSSMPTNNDTEVLSDSPSSTPCRPQSILSNIGGPLPPPLPLAHEATEAPTCPLPPTPAEDFSRSSVISLSPSLLLASRIPLPPSPQQAPIGIPDTRVELDESGRTRPLSTVSRTMSLKRRLSEGARLSPTLAEGFRVRPPPMRMSSLPSLQFPTPFQHSSPPPSITVTSPTTSTLDMATIMSMPLGLTLNPSTAEMRINTFDSGRLSSQGSYDSPPSTPDCESPALDRPSSRLSFAPGASGRDTALLSVPRSGYRPASRMSRRSFAPDPPKAKAPTYPPVLFWLGFICPILWVVAGWIVVPHWEDEGVDMEKGRSKRMSRAQFMQARDKKVMIKGTRWAYHPNNWVKRSRLASAVAGLAAIIVIVVAVVLLH